MKKTIYIFFSFFLFCSTFAFSSTRYWVGGSGNWSDASHWSFTSGGGSGASIPELDDDVIIDANSFSTAGQITFDKGFIINSLTSNPSVQVNLFSSVSVVGLVDKTWKLNGLTTNNIHAAVHQINRQNSLSYKYFDAEEFIGVTDNYLNKDAVGQDQVLQVTSVTYNITEETCPESCDGTITATPNDGVGPFVFQWFLQGASMANGNTPNATGVCGGAQTLVIRDLSDPPGTQPYINTVAGEPINVGPAPFASGIIDEIDETCPGANDGQVIAFASGGTAPYDFSWSNGGGTNIVASGLAPGSYTLTITDNRGCVFTQPPTGTVDPAIPPVVNNDVQDIPLCNGAVCTEDITFNVVGFALPFSWANGGSATDLCPGQVFNDVLSYTSPVDNITVCMVPSSYTATTPPVVTATVVEDSPVTCLGVNDGEATASGSGGTGPYDFVWLNVPGNPTTASVTGLSQGTFRVEVTDQVSGCKDTGTVIITSPTPQVVTASASITTIVSCLTASNGEAMASGAGGTPNYTFNWYDAPGAPTSPTVTGLPVGTFNVEVTDMDGCVDTAQVDVVPPAISPVVASISTVDSITCLTAANGSATASGAGGTSPYDFLWYDLAGMPVTPTVNSLPIGTYNVEVTDQDNCKDTATVDIQVTLANPVVASIVSFSDVVCLGLPTGDATASGAGGTAPYDFLWYDLAGMPTTPAVANLNVGMYNVEVTDVDGCKDTATVDIQAPNPPVITTTLNPIVQPTCGIQCDGAGTASAAGGLAPYTYDWFDSPLGTTGPNISNLCPGAYQVAVEDVNGCKDTVTLDLNITPLTTTLDAKTDVLCSGQCTGAIDVSAAGGTPTYNYLWYDMVGNPTSNSLSAVCAGAYNVEVTDAAGCLDTLQVTVTEPPIPLVINIDRQVNNTCVSNCLGEVDLSISGGIPPYNFQWTDSNGLAPVNPSVLSLTNLCNGSYVFEVTDAGNCPQTVTVDIISPILAVNFSVSPICWDDTVANVQAVASVSAPFVYTWLDPVTGSVNNPLQIGLKPGTYNLEVEDNNNCIDTFPFTFVIPQPITANAITGNALCQGICDGTIDVTITGGTAPYGVSWYDMAASPTVEDLTGVCTGIYNMAIQDNNGCRDTLKAVSVDPQIILNTVPAATATTCNGICDGKAWVTVSSGVLPYVYDWYNSPGTSTTDTSFAMCAGTYQVAISDLNGCVDTADVIVNATPAVTVGIINQVNNVCSQDCNGEAEADIAGGLAPYNTLWTNVTGNPTSNLVTNLCNGTYIVEVTDDNGCKDTAQAVIVSAAATAVLTPVNPSCGGYNDGSISANLTGGAAPLSLLWLNVTGNPTSNSVNGLSQGTYNLEVRDLAGCIDTFSTDLIDPFPILSLAMDSQSVSCFGVCDGKAWTTPVGGAGPYQYSWYNSPGGAIIDTVFSLCLGTYHVAVLDNNGCRDTNSVTITNPFSINVSTSTKPPCFGVCDGQITASVQGTGQPYSFLWDDPAVTTDSTALGLCAGTFKVKVTSNGGCIDSASATITENPQITAIVDTTKSLCTNTTNGGAVILASGGTQPFTYLWTNSTVYSSTVPNPNDMGIGKYYITATDDVGCTYSDSVEIVEQYFIDAFAGNDLTRCVGDSALLVATGGVTYSWNTGSSNDSIVVGPVVTSTYTVTTTNGPCVDADDVVVTINELPDAVATTNRSAILEGMSSELKGLGAGTGGTYDWTPPTGISDPTEQNPVVTPLESTRYYLTVTDANGCRDTSSVFVKIIESILYPDGVSPNGDGINDDWPIIYIENFPDAVVEIYNRWGQQLFYSVGYNQRWDGTFKGEELPVGTYYFIIDLGDGLPKYTGPITIFR